LIKTLAGADLLISGGGSLLQDVTSWRSIVYYLGVIALARLVGTRVMYYAQGVGPIRRRWTRWLTRIISDRVNLITLRDEGSRRELEELGVKRPPVVVTADPVLGLEIPAAGPARAGQPMVGISLRQWGRTDGYKRVVAEAADFLAGKGWKVVFLPFYHPDDVQASLEAAAMMKRPSRVIEEKLTAAELLQQVGGLDLLIGMRLHSLVFAAVNGVPMLGISYDPKVDSFLEGIGREPVGSVDSLPLEGLISRLESTIARLDQERDYISGQAETLKARANRTAQLALRLLDSPKPDLGGEPAGGAVEPKASGDSDRARVEVLGARVDALRMEEAVDRIAEFISDQRPRRVVTLNSELLYRAQREKALLELVNQADLVTADGTGVVWAARQLRCPLPEKVTGVDLILRLAPVAAQKGWRVFLLGSQPGTAEAAAERLSRIAPGINIAGFYHGYFQAGPEEEAVLKIIEEKSPDLLLVAMGAPRQDYWIQSRLSEGKLRVPVSIGVGGSLDVFAGRVKRAPGWMISLGLEWLWRLLLEPWRYKRMTALPRFALAVLRIKNKQRTA
jgi:N-acetylglucosaminyldiphosphoundecaprenol N-acetyl-beta-D-mannosaminyltransferase